VDVGAEAADCESERDMGSESQRSIKTTPNPLLISDINTATCAQATTANESTTVDGRVVASNALFGLAATTFHPSSVVRPPADVSSSELANSSVNLLRVSFASARSDADVPDAEDDAVDAVDG